MKKSSDLSFTAALKVKEIRLYIGTIGFFTMASRALAVIIGFQIFQITRNPLALGWLGFVEAIPALCFVLFGGHIADYFNRHKIILLTGASAFLCALALAFLSLQKSSAPLLPMYGVVFLAGVARGFADPAHMAFEAQVVPKHLTVNASSWISSTWIVCSVVGPAIIGFIFEAWHAEGSYLLIAFLFLLSWICTVFIKPAPQIFPKEKEPMLKSIGWGWHFVFSHQPLLGAITLDLFAVLFGGAVALLPIYADTILHVGARGLGLLNAAPALGALITTLFATRHPPMANAGRNLLFAVGGFGISIFVFAFSKIFLLSLITLALSGAFDGISVVIRRSMVRLLSPEAMRGRVAAVNWIFVGASNELGAFESGMVAGLIGTVPCVAAGAIFTLALVGYMALFAKELRELKFDHTTLEKLL